MFLRTISVFMIAGGLAACGSTGDFAIDAPSVDEQGLDANAMLGFLNGPDATLHTLTVDAHVSTRSAVSILRHVRGVDGVRGTHDDNLIGTLTELRGIRYVGPGTLTAIDNYARAHAVQVDLTIEGVDLSNAVAAQITTLCNSATVDVLDRDVGLDVRAARGLVAARPLADIHAVAAVSFVATRALTKLRDYVLAHQAVVVPPAEAPIPLVLEWINDYRGTDTVSRLNLNRDGSYNATVAGVDESGVYFGPRTVPSSSPLSLRLVSSTGVAWSADLTMYTSTSAIALRNNVTSTLLATLPTDGEDACDSGHGQYLDDDANSDGLYCACADGLSWIPSQGGCIP
jgi:hypothetical protein